MAVTASAFPSCCGASILTGFETYFGTSEYDPRQGKYVPVAKVTDPHAKMIEIIKNKTTSMYNGHQFVAILNASQRQFGWDKALIECGFVPIRAWVNGVHNSELVMYSFVFTTNKDPNSKTLDDKYVFTAEGKSRPKPKKVEKTLVEKIVNPFSGGGC